MPRKIRELVRDPDDPGFEQRPGKGSHRNFKHPVLGVMVTTSGGNGDDAKRYLEKAVQAAIEEVRQWGRATDT
jgi:predicted RNA binding protein YcfA (HicA-like mRNA interferase family)